MKGLLCDSVYFNSILESLIWRKILFTGISKYLLKTSFKNGPSLNFQIKNPLLPVQSLLIALQVNHPHSSRKLHNNPSKKKKYETNKILFTLHGFSHSFKPEILINSFIACSWKTPSRIYFDHENIKKCNFSFFLAVKINFQFYF